MAADLSLSLIVDVKKSDNVGEPGGGCFESGDLPVLVAQQPVVHYIAYLR